MIIFFFTALTESSKEYSLKLAASNVAEKTIHALGWEIDDLQCLNNDSRRLVVEMSALVDIVRNTSSDLQQINYSQRLSTVRSQLNSFIKSLSKHTRNPASHIFVIMISPEKRDMKPYAIPVQCIPYRGLKDSAVRSIINKLVKEMHNRGMAISGKLFLSVLPKLNDTALYLC